MGRRRARWRDAGPPDPEAAPPASTGRMESACWRLVQWCERPWPLVLCVALLVVAGLLVRLPHAYDEAHYFQHHADEPTYYNKAMELLGGGPAAPLAHGGSGLPVFLEGVFKLVGHGPGGMAAQGSSAALDAATLDAARLAYLANTLVGVLVVPASFWLASAVLRPAKALLATALVAFDPFLLFFSGHLMTEQLFTTLVVAGVGCVLRARDHPAWLVGAGVAGALANTVRGNGIAVFAALILFAALLLRKGDGKGWVKWTAVSVVAFFVVQAPYLVWRAHYLPGAFDYGTNGRLWADRLWDFSDPYWQSYSLKGGGHKESISDYFATHSFGQALRRFWLSIVMQVADLFGGANTGHRAHPEGVALNALVSVPALVGLVALRRRRELWAFPILAGVTVLSLTWMYWIHDSPRYFCMLVPLAAVPAVEGLSWLGHKLAMAGTLAMLYLAAFLGLFAVVPILDGFAALGHGNPSWALTLTALVLALGLGLAEPAWAAWQARRRAAEDQSGSLTYLWKRSRRLVPKMRRAVPIPPIFDVPSRRL